MQNEALGRRVPATEGGAPQARTAAPRLVPRSGLGQNPHGQLRPKPTAMTQRGKSEAPARSDRADRLRAALRENLKRRKAQAKGRAQESGPDSPEDPGEGPSGQPPSGPRPGKGAG